MDGITKPPGFTKRPNQKPIETFVRGYLRLVTSGNRLREERKFIEKAIIMINKVFGHPCCDVPTSVIDFGTPYDNQLTNTIRNLIINGNPIRRSFILSLKRILDLLNDYLYGCCTQTLTINFPASVLGTLVQLQVYDISTGALIYNTLVQDNIVQTVSLPDKYFGPASLVKICLNVIVPAGGITNYYVKTGVTTIIVAKNVGQICAITLGPLQSSYTLTQA